jgi:hypothetical protein
MTDNIKTELNDSMKEEEEEGYLMTNNTQKQKTETESDSSNEEGFYSQKSQPQKTSLFR